MELNDKEIVPIQLIIDELTRASQEDKSESDVVVKFTEEFIKKYRKALKRLADD